MILIISEEDDMSTNYVLDWLRFRKQRYIRINKEDQVKLEWLKFSESGWNFSLCVNDKQSFRFSELKSTWYRRGELKLRFKLFSKKIPKMVKMRLVAEYGLFENFIYSMLEKIPNLATSNTSVVDKLLVLDKANSVGLKAPNTYLIDNNSELQNLFDKYNGQLISKGIFETVSFEFNDWQVDGLTQNVTKEDIDMCPEKFALSMVQEKIKKKIEIRVFSLKETCYSLAIFSQNNKNTQTDYRNYDNVRPNRTVPYNLPAEIEQKVLALNEAMGLKTSSIDLILDYSDDYIFLDLNPVGQYGMVSTPCNYYLNDKISKTLINECKTL